MGSETMAIKDGVLISLHGGVTVEQMRKAHKGPFLITMVCQAAFRQRVLIIHKFYSDQKPDCEYETRDQKESGVFRVGTSIPLAQFYVHNPETDWSQAHCVIFANGQRQFINCRKQ